MQTDAAGAARAFVAIPVPEPQRAALARHLDLCARLAPAFRWVAAANLHLTLRFLGRLGPLELARVRAELVGLGGEGFAISLDGQGTFGPRSAPRVVWVRLAAGSEHCAALAARVESACRAAGLAPEARPYRSHVTLARARRPAALPELPMLPMVEPWRATEIVLYDSRPGRGGSMYAPLDRWPLSGGAD